MSNYDFTTSVSDATQTLTQQGVPVVIGDEREGYLSDVRRGSHWQGKPDENEYKRIDGVWTHINPITGKKTPLDNSLKADENTKKMISDLGNIATQKDFDISEPLTWVNKDELTIAKKIEESNKYPGANVINVGKFVEIRLPNGKTLRTDPDNEEESNKTFKELNDFYNNNTKEKDFLSTLQFEDVEAFNNIWGQAGYSLSMPTTGNIKTGQPIMQRPVLMKDGKEIDLKDAKGIGLDKVRNHLYNNSSKNDINEIRSTALEIENTHRENSKSLKKQYLEDGGYQHKARNEFVRNNYSDYVLAHLDELDVSQETRSLFENKFKSLSNQIQDNSKISFWDRAKFHITKQMDASKFFETSRNERDLISQMTDMGSVINNMPDSNPDKKKLQDLFNKNIKNPSFNPNLPESVDNPKTIKFMDDRLKNAVHQKELEIINDVVRSDTDKEIREDNKDLLEVGAEIKERKSLKEKEKLDKIASDFQGEKTSKLETSMNQYQTDVKNLAKSANKNGISVAIDDNGNFIIDGKDKDKVEYYKNKFGILKNHAKGKISDYNDTAKNLRNEYLNWQNEHGETLDLIDQTTRESDIWKISSVELSNGFRRIGYAGLGLIDETAAMRKKQWMEEGVEKGLEKKVDYLTAARTGQGGRFALREASTQGANTLIAMSGTGLVGGMFGVTSLAARATAPTLFGVYSGSDKYLEMSIQQEAADMAKQRLKALDKQRALMSEEDYIKTKIQLEKTIALGDIDQETKMNVALTSGLIEAGVMSLIGTVPNTLAIAKRLKMPQLDMSNKIMKSNFKAGIGLGGTVVKQTAGEIIEETSIEALNILNDGLVLGRDMDFTSLDDVAVTSIISAGPTTGSFATYSTIMEQMQTAPYRKEISQKLGKLSELETKLGDPNLTSEMRDIYTDQYKAQIEDISNAHNGLEVDALAVGSKNIKKLLKASIEENYLNAIAGVNPNDNKATIQAKRQSYIKSLNKSEAKNYQDKLAAIQTLRNDITDNINYDDVAEKAFGDMGVAMQERLENNPKYKQADKRGKLVMVLDTMRKQRVKDNVKMAKQDPLVKQQVDEILDEQKLGKTQRAEKEKALYEDFANRLLVNQRQAYMQASEGNTNAENILSTEQLSKLQIVEQKDKEKMKEAVWKSESLTTQDKIGISKAIGQGKAKGVIIDNKYIVFNKEAAKKNLEKGDLLQGTVMSHEISHFIDDHSFKDEKEKSDYTEKLHGFISKNSNGVHQSALKRVNGLIDVDGTPLYNENKDFEGQSIKYKDEYTKSVQDLLMRDDHSLELQDLRNKSAKGIKNIVKGLVGKDFSIYTDKNAGAWMIDFIDNFRKGKLSSIAKRKMKAAEKLGRSVATETKGVAQSADIVDQTKENLQQIVDDASVINEETGEKVFDKSKFNPDSLELQSELPGMVNAQVNNWFKKYPQLTRNWDFDAIKQAKQEIGSDVLVRMLTSKTDRSFDGRGSLYGFLNGRIRYRMLDHFADPAISAIPDFSQEEINEQRQQLDKEFADDLTKIQNQESDQPRNKVNMLTSFSKLSPKQDNVKEIVEVKEGDTHADVNDSKNVKGNTGKVAEEIFNVPAKKILDRDKKGKSISANLTYAKTISEDGIPEPSEAGNIQSFYTNDNDVKNLVKSLPEFNITINDSDINELGENIQVSPDVKGRSLGLKNRLIDFFYEPYIDPKATNEDPDIRAESITNPKGRSRGKSSQPSVYRLKPEFRKKVISTETINKIKEEAGITPRLQLNKYNRTIGQFLKGLGFYQAQQAALSGAQRKLADQLQEIVDDPNASVEAKREAAKKLKQQIADITVGQGKYSFSADAFIESQDILNISLPFNPAELEGKTIDALLTRHGKGKTLNLRQLIKTPEGRKEILNVIEKKLLPIMPKEFWFPTAEGTAFTASNANYGISMSKNDDGTYKDPEGAAAYNEFRDEVKKLKNLPDSAFGKPIKGITEYNVSKYSSIFKNHDTIEKNKKNGKIKEWNNKVTTIHREMWKRLNEAIAKDKTGEMAGFVGTYLKLVANDKNHFHRLGAEFVGHSPVLQKTKKGKYKYEYEHAMPATAAYIYLMDAAMQDGVSFDAAYDLVSYNYKLIALDKSQDEKLGASRTIDGGRLQVQMPTGWSPLLNSWFERYFNDIVARIDGGINPESIIGLDGRTFGEIYDINAEGNARVVNNGVNTAFNMSKAANNARKTNFETKSRGMSAFDFDETLIDKGENKIIATKGDETIEITSAQWPIEGPILADQGYEFNFDDFINVRGGVEGPLMQKFRNRIEKYGIENNYILTARPQESASAIQAWLKQQGIDMPIENITGLGNSTGEAKAMWMAGKYAEGYNDMYFVDDALPNVDAVKDMMNQLDIKGSSVQAKINFSKGVNETFNDIIEKTTGIESQKQFSDTQAKLRGNKTKYKSIIPASAQDFQGLLYNFLGKGKQGEADMAFFKKALIDPFARGINELNSSRQTAANDFKNLNKKYPKVKNLLNKKIEGLDYTYDQAARVYLWNKAGFEIPGLSKRDLKTLTDFVETNSELKSYADAIGLISKKDDGYSQPKDYWLAESIASDLLSDGAIGDKRSDFLGEWIENKNMIFSPENLNKIEAIYGSKFREALEDMLYRMETGRNRPMGGGRLVNGFMNWTNNSVEQSCS